MFCPLLTHYPSLFSRHCSDHLEVAPMTQKPPSSRTQLPPLFPPSKLEGEFCWSNSLRQNSTNSIRTLKPSSISQGVAGGRRKAFAKMAENTQIEMTSELLELNGTILKPLLLSWCVVHSDANSINRRDSPDHT